jgi:NADPH:quinone reductase-like Zn-dependent oxidoreductase
MMKAILCARPVEDMSTTTLTDVPIPEPAAGEVRVKVGAASLNPVDWKLAVGVAPWWHDPHIVGLDAAGEIHAVGAEVAGWKLGDRVVWHGNLNRQGVFAEFATVPSHVLTRVPETVSWQAAAALPCAGLTAFQALVRKIRLSSDQTIVVQGASGGVGGFAVQIAKIIGARVIALATPEKSDRVLALGADEVLDYRLPDLRGAIRALTDGLGADAVLEVFNPGDARKSLELLRYNAHMASTDPLPDLSQTPPYTYGASIHEIALGGAYGAGDMKTQRDFAVMGDQLVAWVTEKRLDPMITHEIALDQVPDFLGRLRRREFDGKVVVTL